MTKQDIDNLLRYYGPRATRITAIRNDCYLSITVRYWFWSWTYEWERNALQELLASMRQSD